MDVLKLKWSWNILWSCIDDRTECERVAWFCCKFLHWAVNLPWKRTWINRHEETDFAIFFVMTSTKKIHQRTSAKDLFRSWCIILFIYEEWRKIFQLTTKHLSLLHKKLFHLLIAWKMIEISTRIHCQASSYMCNSNCIIIVHKCSYSERNS